ncbi:DNA polymerase III subunit epsilon [Marinicauda salina]|uniref:DNA polymerase III subunit epsilon n=1 Tax=Marinicauda salina TaxID=2135793 RepID=A0A2U2BWG9_9PROT|nr:DNA polymerase III subunit epsilon [Marinicauda salina]PWE18365.1 DNA polymerase III subunit epsilon [Marinicauda salina]
MTREIIFDTETTGLDPLSGDRITEIGCVEVEGLIPTGREFRKLINPERDIPAEVTEVTGHTREMLENEPVFAEIVDEFLAFVGDAPLVAHNAPFDRGFINMELERCGRPAIADDRFKDTAAMARERFPGAPASLDALCKRFDISLDSRTKHGALIDAYLLAEVYLELHGGRERRLEFAGGAAAGAKVEFPARPPRPEPLAPRSTPEERAAHAEFVAEMETSVWVELGVIEVAPRVDE